MNALPFAKVQSIGNDFVLLRAQDAECPDEYRVRALCQRRFGIGADGLLWLEELGPTELSLRMFNADGSEDFCGNGLRCAVKFSGRKGHLVVHHGGVPVQACVLPNGAIRTTLAPATFEPAKIPLSRAPIWEEAVRLANQELIISTLSTGSAHTVIFVEARPEDDLFFPVSLALESHPWFPERTSVMWAYPFEGGDEGALSIRIFERGVGETLGCGTGSTAVALAQMRRRGRGGRITVHNPGGSVVVESAHWHTEPTLEGRAHVVYCGTVDFAGLARVEQGMKSRAREDALA